MTTSTDPLSQLSVLLNLPRRFAPWVGEGFKGYNRSEGRLLDRDLMEQLLKDVPLTVAIKDWADGAFQDTQSFAIFDVDNKDDFEDTKSTARKICIELDHLEVSYLLTPSRGKGFHVWVFFKRPIPCSVVSKFQNYILGYKMGLKRIKTEEYTNDVGTIVETLIAEGDGKVVKIPFSIHPRHETRRELPIRRPDILDYEADHVDGPKDWTMAEMMINHCQSVDPKQLYAIIDEDYQYTEVRSKTPRPTKVTFKMPKVAGRQKEIFDKISNTPCLSVAHNKATTEHGVYWERAILVLTLASSGYKPEEIAVFFRDNICDAEDLMNVGELEKQISYWYDRKHESRCEYFQQVGGNKQCCPGLCGRLAPHEKEPEFKLPFPVEVEGGLTGDIFGRIYEDGRNYQVYKTTRAKVTTMSIIKAVQVGKKILQVVPTVKIAQKTFTDTINIANKLYNLPIRGAVLRDIRFSCLKLYEKVLELRDRHGRDVTAFEELRYVNKPRCKGCEYNNRNYEFEVVGDCPIIDSEALDDENSKCAYMSIMNHRDEFDVMVITYRKLLSLLQAEELGDCGPFESGAQRLLSAIKDMDIIMFDEVGQFTDSPTIEIPIETVEQAGRKYDYFSQLNDEIAAIKELEEHEDQGEDIEYEAYKFQKELDGYIETDFKVKTEENVRIYNRRMKSGEILELLKRLPDYMKSIIEIATEENRTLNNIIDSMTIMTEYEWVVVSIPTESKKINIRLMIAPKMRDAFTKVGTYFQQRIYTDGTMPLINMENITGSELVRLNIGDPENTSDLCRIIPDQKTVFSTKILNRAKELKGYIKMAHILFGEDLIIATTNKRFYGKIKTLARQTGATVRVVYHRSDETIGQRCDQRVMINVCAPYSPKHSMHWLKQVYSEHLEDYTVDDIWKYEKIKTEYQTISRVKDPHCRERSVVINYGQDEESTRDSVVKCVSPPKVLPTTLARKTAVPLQLAQAWLWWKKGFDDYNRHDLAAMGYILRGKKFEDCRSNIKITRDRYQKLYDILEDLLLLVATSTDV